MYNIIYFLLIFSVLDMCIRKLILNYKMRLFYFKETDDEKGYGLREHLKSYALRHIQPIKCFANSICCCFSVSQCFNAIKLNAANSHMMIVDNATKGL